MEVEGYCNRWRSQNHLTERLKMQEGTFASHGPKIREVVLMIEAMRLSSGGSVRYFVCGSGLLGFSFWNQQTDSKNLEPNWMANWLIAAFPVIDGFFHFRVMFCKAR